jgi:ComF family protein
MDCLMNMPSTEYSSMRDNEVERMLTGRFPFEAATAIYHFHHGNRVRDMVHAMKFHGNVELCRMMGRQMGLELMRSARFDDVEMLVPVPLHWIRRILRGYNQSELLCRGIADVTGWKVNTTALMRHRYTRKQSLQRGSKRAENVDKAFKVRRADELSGRHLLLVDDVLTTGATITACADAIAAVPDVKISVATFCCAKG